MRTKEEITEHLDKLFENLKKYPFSEAIANGIEKDLEELSELEGEL